jgi:hypothetical protein
VVLRLARSSALHAPHSSWKRVSLKNKGLQFLSHTTIAY